MTQIFYREEVSSTQDEILNLTADNSGDILLYANQQNAGRGRLGRTWVSEKGNLYASYFTTVKHEEAQTDLVFMAAIAMYATLKTLAKADNLKNVDLMFKWPNDLILNKIKISGFIGNGKNNTLVIGFGVNLVSSPDFATSWVKAFGSNPPPSRQIVVRWLRAFLYMRKLYSGNKLNLHKALNKRMFIPKEMQQVTGSNGKKINAYIVELMKDFRLKVRLENGDYKILHDGIITELCS